MACLKVHFGQMQVLVNPDEGGLFFFSILFCLIPFWGGDYFHYMEIFPMLKQGWNQLNVEEIYEFFARYSPDYHFFRFIIWGTAFWLVCKCIRILHLNFDLSIFFFTSLFLYKFSYARVSLCMAIMYLGLAVMSKNKLRCRYICCW